MEQNLPLRANALSALNAHATRKKVIWRFSDGRPGHDAQSKGLISSLSALLDCDHHDLPAAMPISCYGWGLLKKYPPARDLADPDLIVGAGHATHLPMLLARHARGGRALVLMKPGLPTRFFDLCLIPNHDNCDQGKNIIMTTGLLNLIRPSNKLSSKHGLILIGGESKHFFWEEKQLMQQLLSVLAGNDIHWVITDSPRTPDSTRSLLQNLVSEQIDYIPYDDKNATGITDLLQKAGAVWVSEDSMSMIYEALSTGAMVGVLSVAKKGNSRLAVVAQSLADKQMLSLYDNWLSNKSLMPPALILNESDRCAKLLVGRLGWNAAAKT